MTDAKRVLLSDLLKDGRFQIRRKLDAGTVARYESVLRSERVMPPIRVANVTGSPVLIDGWHRVAAMERLGIREADAIVVEATEREAQWLAAQANFEHGLPLTSSEVRQAFKAFVRARKHIDKRGRLKSFRDIAVELGGLKAHTTIRHWMQKDFPKVAAEYGREASHTNIGGATKRDTMIRDAAEEGLQVALAASRGVTDPEERGRLIRLAEQVVELMKAHAPWKPEEANDF